MCACVGLCSFVCFVLTATNPKHPHQSPEMLNNDCNLINVIELAKSNEAFCSDLEKVCDTSSSQSEKNTFILCNMLGDFHERAPTPQFKSLGVWSVVPASSLPSETAPESMPLPTSSSSPTATAAGSSGQNSGQHGPSGSNFTQQKRRVA